MLARHAPCAASWRTIPGAQSWEWRGERRVRNCGQLAECRPTHLSEPKRNKQGAEEIRGSEARSSVQLGASALVCVGRRTHGVHAGSALRQRLPTAPAAPEKPSGRLLGAAQVALQPRDGRRGRRSLHTTAVPQRCAEGKQRQWLRGWPTPGFACCCSWAEKSVPEAIETRGTPKSAKAVLGCIEVLWRIHSQFCR